MNIHRRRRSQKRNRKGAVVVEMAVTLPVLFLILFACYEFGRANLIRHSAQGAAYEAARIAIVPGATAQEIQDTAEFFLSSCGVHRFDLEVTPDVITDQTETVNVLITVAMTENSIMGLLFNENSVFEGRCELIRESID